MKYKVLSCLLVFASASSALAMGPARDAAKSVASNVKNSQLIHTWEREHCADADTLGASHRVLYQLQGKEIRQIEQYFSAPGCQDLAVEIKYSGDFETKNEVQRDIHEINMNFTKVTVTAKNETGRNLLNAATFCGNSRWETNKAVDLSSYTHGVQCSLDNLPKRSYDIVSVEKPRLYFGKGGDKSFEFSRPIEIDREVPFLQN